MFAIEYRWLVAGSGFRWFPVAVSNSPLRALLDTPSRIAKVQGPEYRRVRPLRDREATRLAIEQAEINSLAFARRGYPVS